MCTYECAWVCVFVCVCLCVRVRVRVHVCRDNFNNTPCFFCFLLFRCWLHTTQRSKRKPRQLRRKRAPNLQVCPSIRTWSTRRSPSECKQWYRWFWYMCVALSAGKGKERGKVLYHYVWESHNAYITSFSSFFFFRVLMLCIFLNNFFSISFRKLKPHHCKWTMLAAAQRRLKNLVPWPHVRQWPKLWRRCMPCTHPARYAFNLIYKLQSRTKKTAHYYLLHTHGKIWCKWQIECILVLKPAYVCFLQVFNSPQYLAATSGSRSSQGYGIGNAA